MIGLGTIINTGCILAGGLFGHLFGRLFKPHHQETLTMACGISVLFLGISGALHYMLDIYVANNTDKVLVIDAEDASINGFMADPFYYTLVSPGKSAFTQVSWSMTDLEKNKITDINDIEEIEFRLVARDYNDWSAAPLVDEIFTLTP